MNNPLLLIYTQIGNLNTHQRYWSQYTDIETWVNLIDIWLSPSTACQGLVAADQWPCPQQKCSWFRASIRTCLRGWCSLQPNQELQGGKWWDPVRLQQQLDLLSSNRQQVELRLELRVAPNQSSKLESPKNYKIVFLLKLQKHSVWLFCQAGSDIKAAKLTIITATSGMLSTQTSFKFPRAASIGCFPVCMQSDAAALLCEPTLTEEEDDKHAGKDPRQGLVQVWFMIAQALLPRGYLQVVFLIWLQATTSVSTWH